MAANISVYGYDHRMLESDIPTQVADGSNTESNSATQEASTYQATPGSTQPLLLNLPTELRDRIYELVLPSTVEAGTKGIAWVRGHCAILATSKRVYHEGIRAMYGRNTFVVDVVWDEVRFTYQWVLPTALVPKRTFAFPDKLAERNVSLIRKLLIRIHHVDNYTGMVKHNFGGPGLREGLRIQVEKLCQSTLQQMYEISHLHIHFRNDSQIMSVDQAILRPFMNLTNTRTLKLTGSITADLASTLQAQLTDAYSRNSTFRLPLELRERVYDLVLPTRAELKVNAKHTPSMRRVYIRWEGGDVGILRTCTTIHNEASSLLYRTRHIIFHCLDDGVLNPGRLSKALPDSPNVKDSLCWSSVRQIKYLLLCITRRLDRGAADAKCDMEAVLETVKTIAQHLPNIRKLGVNFFRWNPFTPTQEHTLNQIIHASYISNVRVFGIDSERKWRAKDIEVYLEP